MFNIRARFDNERAQAHLEEFTLIDIKSYAAWEPWVHPPSWRLRAGFSTPHDLNRRDERSNIFGVGGGSGITLPLPGVPGGAFYGLIEGQADAGGSFRDDYRLGAGGSSGVLFDTFGVGRTHVSAGWMRYGVGNITSVNTIRAVQAFFLTPSLEARVTLERQNGYREGVVALNLYY
jgi:hypothetical protein